MGLVSELRRRNVLRMAVLYVVAAWLIMQVAEVVIALANLPAWTGPVVLALLTVGLPIALVLSWFYEITPEGLTLEKEVPTGESITRITGRRMDFIVIALLGAAVILFAYDKWWVRAAELSIAILPFENLSADPHQAYFTDGMHDELLTRLSQISELKVVSRTSVMPYRDSLKPLPTIAKELAVANIVEGGVQRFGDQMRINVQLIDAATDEHLWADTYDRALTAENLFAVQSEKSTSIASALKAELTPDESLALEQTLTDNLQAYETYMAGRAKLHSAAGSDVEEAASHFSIATRLDSNFAAAWAGLCEAHLMLYRRTRDAEHFATAEKVCTNALNLDDSRAEVHVAMALLYSYSGKYSHAEVSLRRADFAKAEQALDRIGSFDDLSIQAKLDLGMVLANQGRLAEAETTLHEVAKADPRNWQAQTSLFSFYYTDSDLPDRFERAAHHASLAAALRPEFAAVWNNLGSANYMLARYDQAADAWQHSIEIEPTRTAYTNTGIALYNAKRFGEAAAMQEKAIEISPDDHRAWGRLGDALRFVKEEGSRAREAFITATMLARKDLEVNDQSWRTWGLLSGYLVNTGHVEDATFAAERAMKLARRNSESLYYAAYVELAAGKDENALELLEEAVAKDPAYRDFIGVDPGFVPLAGHPRFQVLIGDL